MQPLLTEYREIRHAHFFAGLGGGAKGFNKGHARVANMQARFRCIGGIDNNAAAVRDFKRLTGVDGTLLDLFDYEQYRAFHGCEPPVGWREANIDDVRKAFNYETPHIIFLSPPCKGFSALLSEKMSKSVKYQALNRLVTRGLFLALEAYQDDLPELILLECAANYDSRPVVDRSDLGFDESLRLRGGGDCPRLRRDRLACPVTQALPHGCAQCGEGAAVPLRAGKEATPKCRRGTVEGPASWRSEGGPDAPSAHAHVENVGAFGVCRSRRRLADPQQAQYR